MDDGRVEINLRPGIRTGRVGLLVLGIVLLPAIVSFWVDPPRSGWFGTSGLLARVLALIALPAVLYMIAGIVRSFLRRGPELMMDSSGIEANALLSTHRVRWDDIGKFTNYRSEAGVLIVHVRSGKRFKIHTTQFEDGWDRELVASEMRRLSGGRVPELPR